MLAESLDQVLIVLLETEKSCVEAVRKLVHIVAIDFRHIVATLYCQNDNVGGEGIQAAGGVTDFLLVLPEPWEINQDVDSAEERLHDQRLPDEIERE